jgi:hypothetical protein
VNKKEAKKTLIDWVLLQRAAKTPNKAKVFWFFFSKKVSLR